MLLYKNFMKRCGLGGWKKDRKSDPKILRMERSGRKFCGKKIESKETNAVRYTKKKLEHWQVVYIALAGYDAIAIILSFFWHCGFGLTADIL